MHSRFIHVAANGKISFFFNDWVLYHIFIHSPVDGHLGYFQILAIGNDAAMNFEVHVSFWVSIFIFLDIYPGVELLHHVVILFFFFLGTSIVFSIMAALIYIPTNSVQRLPFLHILDNIFYL